jgi:long-chain acyl-CoA synthetase
VLLHSSGTTGMPKGIPLRHRNVTGGLLNASRSDYFRQHEELYAYLPTAWVGDFVFTLGAGMMMAATINIPERQETVLRDLREVSPTFYLAAPRAWDQMLTRVQVGMKNSTPFKRWLFETTMERAVALERKRLAGGVPTLKERLQDAVGNLLVYAPLRDHLGLDRAERAFTGGEALGEDTFLFFRALGIKLKQFYGQTETCALTAAQTEGQVKLHTVGHPMEGSEIRIDDAGEILVRSSSVVDGYYDDPESSAKALVDGWLHTGDAGRIDEDGQLVVLGRVSEVVRTASGERYIPNFIENRLKFSPYHPQCRGDRRRARQAHRDRLHRLRRGRPLGRGARHLLHLLCRALAETRGAGADRPGGQARQRHAAGRPAHPPFRQPAQGFRRR